MPVNPGVVVPAIPPRPPQVSLATSAVRPDLSADPSNKIFEIPADVLAALPDEQRKELEEREGESWVRGFQYAPESHEAAALRGVCDTTSMDTPQLPAPVNVAAKAEAGKGTIAGGTKTEYKITAIDPNGQTTGSLAVKATLGAEGGVKLTWNSLGNEITYGVYGRKEGEEVLLIEIVGPFDDVQKPEFLDNGSKAPKAGKKVPVANTTGGTGHYYNNLPLVSYIPYLAIAGDRCSSWGFEERDFKGRATRMLENATPRALERELWEGNLSQKETYGNDFLANHLTCTDLTPGGGAPSVKRGLQILQDALQQCGFGGQGMIHVQPQTSPDLLGARRVGPMFYDIYDNIVVPGAGYTGVGPKENEKGETAPPEGKAWMYATDLVMIREGDIEVFPDTFAEALDRGENGFPNTITFRAERFLAAYFDGACHFTCEVELAK